MHSYYKASFAVLGVLDVCKNLTYIAELLNIIRYLKVFSNFILNQVIDFLG